MEPWYALAAGLVMASALQSLLRKDFLRMVIGFMLVSNAVNLVIFTVGRLTRGAPPIVPHDAYMLEDAANPLPQALILTAIVISFGLTAFTFSLAYRVHKTLGTLDTDQLTETEIHESPDPAKQPASGSDVGPSSEDDWRERHLPA